MKKTDSGNNTLASNSGNQPYLKSIGPLIKQAREQKKISIAALSESLKINKGYLQAIEDGDERALPEKIYTQAMIRRISEKLSLNINLKSFSKQNNQNIPHKEKKKQIINFKKSYIILPIFAIITIFLGALTTQLTLEFFLKENITAPNNNINSYKQNNKEL